MTGSVVVVTNIPRPYRRALFDTLQEKLDAEDLTLQVLYTSNPAKHVRRGAPAAVDDASRNETWVPSRTVRVGYERVFTVTTRLRRVLSQVNPTCVVSGGFGASSVASVRWCRSAKVPHVLWSGAWPGHEGKVTNLQLAIRKWLVRSSSAFIAYGTAAADYLVELGAPRGQVFCAWNTVDLDGFAAAARAASARRPELIPKYRLATKNLVFVGSLVARKGVRELLTAALAVDSPNPDWALHLVGDGLLRSELEKSVRASGREANFRFHGLRPPEDVVELLGVADGFLFPTKQEAWGLVINEAMACGVPVLVSPQAGATRDLVSNGVTGYVVEPTDIQAMAAIISQLLSSEPTPKAIGSAGAEAVRARASLGRATEGFLAAVLNSIQEGK